LTSVAQVDLSALWLPLLRRLTDVCPGWGIWKNADVLASGYSLDAVNIVVRDYERDGSLEVDLFYADDVFDENYRFTDALRHVLTLINKALDEPDMPLGDIDMLSAADHTELDMFSYGAQIDG